MNLAERLNAPTVYDSSLYKIASIGETDPESQSCTGYITKIDGTNETVTFNYHSVSSSTINLIGEEMDASTKSEWEKFCLKDQTFKTYIRPEVQLPEGVKPHRYVLIHGWTSNKGMYSDVECNSGLSVVEEILAKDPTAEVIALDGNGFGGTEFKDGLSLEELKEHSTAVNYARQVDFFCKHVVGKTINQVNDEVGSISPNSTIEKEIQNSTVIIGHSMGGSASLVLASEGYKTVAVAPAAFSTEDAIYRSKQSLRMIGVDTTPYKRLLYDTLSQGTGFGATFARLGERFTPQMSEVVVKQVFNAIGPSLMGKLTGDPSLNSKMIASLMRIHSKELTTSKLDTVSVTLGNLADGTPFESLTPDQVLSMCENASVYWGSTDALVPREEGLHTLAVVASLAIERYKVFSRMISVSPEEKDALRNSAKKAVAFLEESNRSDHTVAGGHYSPCFDYRVINHAIKKGQKNLTN